MLTGYLAVLLPGVVGFVSSCIIIENPLASLGGRLQLPVVDLVEEHLGQLHDGLTFLRWQVAEFVLDKIVHSLFGKEKINKWERGHTETICVECIAAGRHVITCSMPGFSNGGLSCASNVGLPICRMDFLNS